MDRLGWRVWLHRDHPARTCEQRRHRAVRLAEGLRVRSVVSQGALCKPGHPRPPSPPRPPPAPPRGLSPRVVTKARPPPPGAIKLGQPLASRAPRARERGGQACTWLLLVSGSALPRGAAGRGGAEWSSGRRGPPAPRSPSACPSGRTPVRNGVGVGARVTGSAGRQQRRARLQGEQLPSQGELRQGSCRYQYPPPSPILAGRR